MTTRKQALEYAQKIASIDITKESMPISSSKILEMAQALIEAEEECEAIKAGLATASGNLFKGDRYFMQWQGKELKTIGDFCSAMDALENKEEAQKFMALCRIEMPNTAEQNIGYLTGYFEKSKMIKLQEWLEVKHPILD